MAKGWTLTSPQLSENDVEHACLDLVQRRGYKPERLHAGRYRSPDLKRWITGVDPGTPDWICTHGTHPGFYLEVKRPGGKLSPVQEQKIFELRAGYRLAVVAVDSAKALSQWLDEHERGT